jgi:two-component system sensor histidine kinase SenX3
MELLLGVVGAVIASGIGFGLGRSRPRPVGAPRDEPPPPRMPSYDDLLAEHPSGVVIADAQGRLTYRNRSALAMQGTHVGVLLDEAIERHVARANRSEPSQEVLELYGPPKTVLAVAARPLPSGGSVVFVDDISERRRIDQVRTDFVANISHELKTPIGALSVLAETLEEETDPEIVRRVVARMLGEAQRASRTIDDLMELSRIELGGERTIEPVRVADVVRDGIERVTELAAQREIGVTALDPVEGASGRSGAMVVHGDRRQLVSAVGNLVENAVKYSEVGGSVQVRARREGDRIEIAVVDQGVGIPQRDLDRIFERFYRVDRARSRETGGTGLGLSIVRHVATSHGGDVVVSSVEGEGSTFVLRLPAGSARSEQHAPAEPGDRPSSDREGVA